MYGHVELGGLPKHIHVFSDQRSPSKLTTSTFHIILQLTDNCPWFVTYTINIGQSYLLRSNHYLFSDRNIAFKSLRSADSDHHVQQSYEGFCLTNSGYMYLQYL